MRERKRKKNIQTEKEKKNSFSEINTKIKENETKIQMKYFN